MFSIIIGLQLRENIKKGVFVDGLIEKAVTSPVEAYDVSLHYLFYIFIR